MARFAFAFAVFLALAPTISRAQEGISVPPIMQNSSGTAESGGMGGYGYGQTGSPGRQQPGYGPNQPPAPILTGPPGVGKMYGIEGNNTLLVYGTQAGYDLVRQLVRNLDGDTDIDRTTIALIRETPDYLKSLGVTVGADGALTADDAQKLLEASQAGKLTSCTALKITSGDGEEVDTTLNKGAATLPFAVTTTVESISKITVTFTDPVAQTLTLRPGQIGILAVPPAPSDTHPIISLLFVTAGIVKRG